MGRSSRCFLLLAASLLATATLAGCGGSSKEDESDDDGGIQPPADDLCGLSASVSGAYTASRDFTACQGFWFDGTELHVGFGLGQSDWLVDLDIGPVTAGQTATSVPAIVGVSVLDESNGGSWETAEGSCTVDVTLFEAGEDPFFGPGYRVAGEGRCSGPATPTGTEEPVGDVIIAPFQVHFFATTE